MFSLTAPTLTHWVPPYHAPCPLLFVRARYGDGYEEAVGIMARAALLLSKQAGLEGADLGGAGCPFHSAIHGWVLLGGGGVG